MVVKYGHLNDFYRTVLCQHFGFDDNNVITAHSRLILWLKICLQVHTPLEGFIPFVTDLAKEREIVNLRATRRIVRRIVRLLDGCHQSDPYTPFYPSFRAYLDDPSQSGIYSFDRRAAHQEMTLMCIRIMTASLRFNIFGLSSSFLSNKDVDPTGLIHSNISSQLEYACRFWTYHASEAGDENSLLLQEIVTFFETHFLAWLEVMSLSAQSPLDALNLLRSFRVSARTDYTDNNPLLTFMLVT